MNELNAIEYLTESLLIVVVLMVIFTVALLFGDGDVNDL